MRTTLSLDDDVAILLERLRTERRIGLKEIVNDALRLGLRQMTLPPEPRRSFVTQAVNHGRCLIGSIDDVSEVLALVEGEDHR